MTETIHACPPAGSSLTPCCARTPLELPLGDRMVVDQAAVTCAGAAPAKYPHPEGNTTVLGSEIFASSDGQVICWKGENYVPQGEPAPDALRSLRDRLAAEHVTAARNAAATHKTTEAAHVHDGITAGLDIALRLVDHALAATAVGTPTVCEFATTGHRGPAFAAKHTSTCDHPSCDARLTPGTLIRSDGDGGYECATHHDEGDPADSKDALDPVPADVRDQIAAAIWERQNPGRRYADCEHPWMADAEEDADAVLRVPAIAYALTAMAELQQLRAEVERQIDAKVGITGQLGNALADKTAAEAIVARIARLADEYPVHIDTALLLAVLDGQAIDDTELQQLRAQVARVRKVVAERRAELAEREPDGLLPFGTPGASWCDAVSVTCSRVEDALRVFPEPGGIPCPDTDQPARDR